MRKTALVVMAAGIGSRFGGGIKQLEPVGPGGEVIMDYSVHDALEAGFDKVVVIIRRDLERDFREMIGDRLERITEVRYAYQELDDLPAGYKRPEGRKKPWGTGQAVLCAKNLIQEPFLVINADDYYGREGFRLVHDYMVNRMDTADSVYDICMGGFILANTLSENGGVTRGVCSVGDGGVLKRVTETYELCRKGELVEGVDDRGEKVKLPLNSRVSMNMWGLPPSFLDELERGFPRFLRGIKEDDVTSEYLLPRIIDRLAESGQARVTMLETRDKWFGVTYQEDKPAVMAAVRELIRQGVYKETLYERG